MTNDIQSNTKSVVDGLYLFSHSEYHNLYSVWEFQAFWLTPVLAGKARVFYDNDKPVALVTWCFLSEQEGRDFLEDRFIPSEAEYARNDGDQLWGIEFIAPFGHASKAMRGMRELCHVLYGNRPVLWRRLSKRNHLHKGAF